MNKNLGFLILCLFIATISNAQEVLKRAHIHYKMADLQSSNAEIQASAAMMGGDLLVYFNENDMRTDISMNQGLMKMSTYMVGNSNENHMYMDMMGSKFKFKMPQDESTADVEKPTIKINKGNKKTILGYECTEVVATILAEGQTIEVKAYVTKRIVAPKAVIKDMGNMVFEGLPLEYSIITPDMTIKYVAEKIDKDIDESYLEQPTGYTEMDFSQMAGAMGGMMGK